MSWIRIPYVMDSNPYSRMSSECLKEAHIRIFEVWIRIQIPESFLRSEKVKFGLWIRIPEVWIRIRILESFFRNEKVKFGHGFESIRDGFESQV